MRSLLFYGAISLFGITSGDAATLTLPPFTVTGPASTAITCAAISTTLTAPVVVGTVLTSCTVSPAAWNGAIALSNAVLAVTFTGTNMFTLKVAGAALAAGTYSETVTATP